MSKAIQPPLAPCIEIQLDNHFSTKVYTSGATLSGRAIVSPKQDVQYDVFEVNFLGIAHTRLDFVQQFPTHSTRIFMKLQMPLSPALLPTDKIFRNGQSYEIPFNFVVPHQLTIGACDHKGTTDAVREQHLRLPPSVGGWVGDDQAPEMAQVSYSLVVKAIKKVPGVKRGTKLFDASRRVKVLPARPEDAPLNITAEDERYTLSKTKNVRKSLFSAKTGTLKVTACQPGALMMSPDGHKTSSSNVRLNLTFRPFATDANPPRITNVSAKLQASTFFSAAPTNRLPDFGRRDSQTSPPSLNYTTTSNISTKVSDKLNWQQFLSSSRRDSGYSSLGCEDMVSDEEERRGSKKQQHNVPHYYRAEMDIPFTAPPQGNKRFFVPSFHSCLVSRVYTLQLNISTTANTTFNLAIPLQIGVESVFEPRLDGALPAFDGTVQEEAEAVDAYLHPRIIGVVPDELMGGSELPGYAAIAPSSVAAA